MLAGKLRKLTPWLMACAFVLPTLAMAAGFVTIVPCSGTDCTICSLAQLAQNIINDAILIAVVISAILFAVAGWKYMTAGGGGEVAKARSIFTNVLIGLIIILAAWLIVNTLMQTLTGGTAWNSVCTT